MAAVVASLVVFAFVAFARPQAACADQFFATQVINTVVGTQQQAPAFANPAKALGAPRGGGTSQNGLDVYNLGNGGSITLGFDDSNPASHRYIVDGPGPDFTWWIIVFMSITAPLRRPPAKIESVRAGPSNRATR